MGELSVVGRHGRLSSEWQATAEAVEVLLGDERDAAFWARVRLTKADLQAMLAAVQEEEAYQAAEDAALTECHR